MNGNPNGTGYGTRNGSYGPPGGYAGSSGGGSHGGGFYGNGSYGTGSYGTGSSGGGAYGTGSSGGGAYGGGAYGGGHGSPYPEPSAPSFTPPGPAGSGAFPPPRSDFRNPPTDQGRYGQTAPPWPGDGAQAGGPRGDGANGGASADGRRGRHGAPEVPVVTGVPVSRAAVPPDSPFDVFTPLHRGDQDEAAPPVGPVNAPYAGSYPDYGSTSPAPPPHTAGNGNNGGNGGDPAAGEAASGGAEDYKGLPRRVRQANLAPQLRSSETGSEPTGIPQAATPSLSDMRNTLSAMQRGWQQGRSQSQRDTEGNVEGD